MPTQTFKDFIERQKYRNSEFAYVAKLAAQREEAKRISKLVRECLSEGDREHFVEASIRHRDLLIAMDSSATAFRMRFGTKGIQRKLSTLTDFAVIENIRVVVTKIR